MQFYKETNPSRQNKSKKKTDSSTQTQFTCTNKIHKNQKYKVKKINY